MRQQCFDIELPPRKDRENDQAKSVPPNVEHEESVHQIYIGKHLSDSGETVPIGGFGNGEPGESLGLNILGFVSQELQQAGPADHVHCLMVAKRELTSEHFANTPERLKSWEPCNWDGV
jgi:hypothetical protein